MLRKSFIQDCRQTSNAYSRFAIWAAALPHIIGIIIVSAYWLTRHNDFIGAAVIGGLLSFTLLIVGLVCVVIDYVKVRPWSNLGWLAFVILMLNIPLSLVYASGMGFVAESVSVTIKNSGSETLTQVILRIEDQHWKRPNIPPGAIDRDILYYGFGNVHESDIELEARKQSGLVTLSDGYLPGGGTTSITFEVK